MPAGVFYSLASEPTPRNFLINDAGQVAFQAYTCCNSVVSTNPYGISDGIWAQRHGNLELVARTDSLAPGTPEGVNFSFLNTAQFSLNNLGQTAFQGFLTGSGVDDTNNVGLWSEGSGSLALLARKGSQAPGMPDGAVFAAGNTFPYAPALNNAGQTAFGGLVTGGGVSASGIWLGTAGNLSLAVREGAQAPATPSGVNFGNLIAPALNDAGQIAFTAGLAGAGVDSTNNFGLWAGAPDSLALVARRGEHAPGTEDGVVFRIFGDASGRRTLILNAAGQTAFFGHLSGSGISGSNDLGIWATDRSGVLQLIARNGDLLEVAPGDFRTVNSLRFLVRGDVSYATGNSDGRPSAFNNRGQLAFAAIFTDGSSGIFVSNAVAIPEPATYVLAIVSYFAITLHRRFVAA
jgi:hypothetical protein